MKNIVFFTSIIIFCSNLTAKSDWNVIPIVNLDSMKNPINCGYLYESSYDKIVLKLEKYVVNNHVITSFSVKNPGINIDSAISLTTKSVNTDKNFEIKIKEKIYMLQQPI